MQAGLQIYNDNNLIQIDSSFSNWSVIKKGTLVLNSSDSEFSSGGTQLNVAGVNPLIAIQGVNNNRTFRTRRLKQANGTFTFVFHMAQGAWAGPPTIKYWIFDQPTQAGSLGLQVFDQASKLVFDSSREYMRVMGLITQTGTFPYFGLKTTEYTFASNSLAVVSCQQAIKTDEYGSGQGNGYTVYSITARPLGNKVITYDGVEYDLGGGLAYRYARPNSSILVLDVSGM